MCFIILRRMITVAVNSDGNVYDELEAFIPELTKAPVNRPDG